MNKLATSKTVLAIWLIVILVGVTLGAYAFVRFENAANNPEISATPKPSALASASPTQLTASPSNSPASGPTTTPRITPVPTLTSTPKASQSPIPVQTSSPQASPTPSLTASPTLIPTPTTQPTSNPTPLPIPTPSPSPTPTPVPSNVSRAINWAGYVVSSDLQNPQPVITGISASWTIPNITISGSDTFSAAWIGVGGQFDHTLIQCGTEQDSINGQTEFFAWYELLPRTSIVIRGITPSAGDQMTASIQLVDPTLSEWTINVTDVTNGQTFQIPVIYSSSQLSAEWIMERPTVNNVLSSLANFGSATFTNCQTTIGSITGGINSFASTQVIMFSSMTPGSGASPLTEVSSVSNNGSEFTVNYLASK